MLRFAVCVLALSVAVPEVFSAPAVAAASSSAKKKKRKKKKQNEQTPLCTPPGSADPLDER